MNEEQKEEAIAKAEAVPEHPMVAKLRKLRGRRLLRMAIESRFKYFPPGSSWKRRDGTIAKAGPKYGARPKPIEGSGPDPSGPEPDFDAIAEAEKLVKVPE
jgi:hypothetical protein